MNPCHWVWKPVLPFAAPVARRVVGPIVRRFRPRLRHAAVWVCSGGAALVPLPGPAPIPPPVGIEAPIYGEVLPGFGGIGAIGSFGAPGFIGATPLVLPGDVLVSLPPRGPLLDVVGDVVPGSGVTADATPVPEPSSAAVMVGALLVLGVFARRVG